MIYLSQACSRGDSKHQFPFHTMAVSRCGRFVLSFYPKVQSWEGDRRIWGEGPVFGFGIKVIVVIR